MNILEKDTKKICIDIAVAILAVLGVLTLSAYAAEIDGMKWNDSNGNALKDAGEIGVQGVTICYYTNSGSPAYPGNCGTITDANGNYSLSSLTNGTYEIYEIIPLGKAQTYPFACPSKANCSGGTGFHEVTVSETDTVTGIDFGNAAASEIRGMKFNDSNGNGARDAGESGVSDIYISLRRIVAPGDERFFGFTQTDINGEYNFTNLSAGYYKVEEFDILGVSQTYPAAGAPNLITLGVGEVKTGVDFGNQHVPPGTISGTKFNDTNGNGVQDAGEGGISGVTILLPSSGRTETTDIDGNYAFTNVPVGMHTIFEELLPGYVATTPAFINVKVNSSETSIVNFGNRKLVPPPSDVNIVQKSGTQNGIPTVNRPGLTTLKIQKNLSGIDVAGVNLTLKWSDGTTKTADMTHVGGNWEATFNPPFPPGSAEMTFKVDVNPPGPSGSDFIEIGDIIFLDPSGQIRSSCDNRPIEGATVTLYLEFPPGSFIKSPSGYQTPDTNPQTTLADGYYRWDVRPFNTYKVGVTMAGFDPNESEPVAVPPPRTDLDILLTPTGGCHSFTGFFSPVENPPTLNIVNAGSAIPLKFSLGGDKGLDIFEVGYPKSSPINCISPDDTIGGDETLAAGKSGLSYSKGNDRYSYVWKTDTTWTGCRQLTMKLNDGTYHRANFKFSK